MFLLASAPTITAACAREHSGDNGVPAPSPNDGNGDSTTGEGDDANDDGSFALACKAFGDLIRMCHGIDEGNQSEAECLEYLEYYANDHACLEAHEAHSICLSALSCEELGAPACGEEEDQVNEACP